MSNITITLSLKDAQDIAQALTSSLFDHKTDAALYAEDLEREPGDAFYSYMLNDHKAQAEEISRLLDALTLAIVRGDSRELVA